MDVVLNLDIPTHSKDYIHRVGRTARAGRSGVSVTFVTQYDVELYQRIEHLIGKKLPVYPTEEGDVMSLLERVAEAQRIAKQVCFFWCGTRTGRLNAIARIGGVEGALSSSKG